MQREQTPEGCRNGQLEGRQRKQQPIIIDMNNIFQRFSRKQVKRQSESQQPAGMESPAPKREKTIPPHIVACKVCEGKGVKDGAVCPQCKGSGRVIVSCEVTIYISAYVPENNQE